MTKGVSGRIARPEKAVCCCFESDLFDLVDKEAFVDIIMDEGLLNQIAVMVVAPFTHIIVGEVVLFALTIDKVDCF